MIPLDDVVRSGEPHAARVPYHATHGEASEMNGLRAAVVGLGWWGKYIVQRLAGSAELRITHAVDMAPEPVADFVREHGLTLCTSVDEVLGDPEVDALLIVTPHSTHEELVIAAAEAGKQVFCEKPLTLTAVSAERMLAACDKAGIVLGIGHERRFEPAMDAVGGMIAAGKLGTLLHLEANVSHDLFAHVEASNWRVGEKDAPAAGMTALGVHLTDLFISFAGRPKAVRARTAHVLPDAAGADHLSIWIDFVAGPTAAITTIASTPYYGRLTVFGSAGWAEARESANIDKELPSELVVSDASGRRTASSFPAAGTVRRNLEAWARAAGGRGQYRYAREQLLDNVRILDAVVRSSKAGGQLVAL
jgi:predicted dehydrogenase